jgi:hypothetical protein
MSRYKVTKHGTLHVDKYRPRFCPECASEMIKSDNKSEVDGVFFGLIKRARTYSCLICPECGCEMKKLEKTKMKPYRLFYKILLSILFISITVFTGWFTGYSFTHDGNLETWVGPLGIIAFFVTIFMVVFDIYYIGDILEHIHIYREY